MFCSQCGKELSENSKFCNNCGAPVEAATQESPVQATPQVTPQEVPKKKSKAGLVIGLVILLLALLAGGGVLFFMNLPVNKISRAFGDGNVEAAVALYDKVTSEKDSEKVVAMATSYAIQLKDDYLIEAEGMTYDMVCNSLDTLDTGITEDSQVLADIKSIVDTYKESRDNYANAEAQAESGNYAEALDLYATVIKADEVYYEKAQNGITTVSDAIRTDAINVITSLADEGDFDGAQAELDNALTILKDDATLFAQQQVLDQKIIDDYIIRAETAISEQRYTDALTIINAALSEFPDNESVIGVKGQIPEEAYLIGNWKITMDYSALMGIMYEELAGMDIPLELTLLLTFHEDGTYYFGLDEDALMETYTNYLLEFTYRTFEDEGMTREDADEMIEYAYGVTMEEYIIMLCETEMENMSEDLYESGSYTIEGNKLYLGDREDYEVFTVSGDTLTVDLPGDSAGTEILPGLGYPMIFERVDNVMVAEGSI